MLKLSDNDLQSVADYRVLANKKFKYSFLGVTVFLIVLMAVAAVVMNTNVGLQSFVSAVVIAWGFIVALLILLVMFVVIKARSSKKIYRELKEQNDS